MNKFRLFLILVLTLGVAVVSQAKSPHTRLETATFAAGCFWCTQPPFDQLKGVLKTTVGYTGGKSAAPTYEQVSSGKTGHAESIEIVYDAGKVSYEELLDVFWHNIDPTTKNRQFPDWGTQYRTAIFYHTEGQRLAAVASKEKLEKSGRFGAPIVTEIVPATAFWPAEIHHQKCYLKQPDMYNRYHDNSGRDSYFKRIWGGS